MHVSTSFKSLEDKGLIRRVQSDENKKRVEIYLLDAAEQIIQDGEKAQKQFIKNIFQGLSEEEITICKTIFNKICTNAESCLNQKNRLTLCDGDAFHLVPRVIRAIKGSK